MGWFSGSGDNAEPSKSFDDHAGSSFGGGGDDYSGGASSMGGGGGMTHSDMQQVAASLQQQAMVQSVITNITDEAVIKCLTGQPKDSKLNGTQVACIHSVVNKWMDTNEYLNGRLAAKSQQAQRSSMQMH